MHRVPQGGERGAHAHRYTQQCLIAVAGAFTVDLSTARPRPPTCSTTRTAPSTCRRHDLGAPARLPPRHGGPGPLRYGLQSGPRRPFVGRLSSAGAGDVTQPMSGSTAGSWASRPTVSRIPAPRPCPPKAASPTVSAARRWLHERKHRRRSWCHVERIPFSSPGMALRARLQCTSGHDSGLLPGAGRPPPGATSRRDSPTPLRAADRQPTRDRRAGILAKRFDGVLHFSAPAPNAGQHRHAAPYVAPTVQAERFIQLHARPRMGLAPAVPTSRLRRGVNLRAGGSAPVRAGSSSSCASATGTSSWRPATTSRCTTTSTG